jgi:FtsH-binding integral membrane protein
VKIIHNDDEYLELFKDDSNGDNNKKLEEALKVALDTRKFEIELYWKRATYFWAFIAASITAFFVLLSSKDVTENHKWFIPIVAFIGYFFSLGWYYVNRGSKYWQENWERHVDKLEKKLHGPLFRYVKVPDKKLNDWMDEYPFSVSKINQFLSLLIVFFWIAAFIYSLKFALFDDGSVWDVLIIVLSILFTIILTVLFTKNTFSFIVEQSEKLSDDDKENALFISHK